MQVPDANPPIVTMVTPFAARSGHQVGDGAVSDAEPARDDQQCRIIVNDLMREIDRLRRGMDRVEICGTDEPDRDVDACVPADPSCPSTDRPIYAVAPLGRPQYAPPPPPLPAPVESIANDPHVTNLGTLLDVLA